MPPRTTVQQWVIDDVQGFSVQYTRARDIGLDALADEILDATANPAPEGVDLRIWFASSHARGGLVSDGGPPRGGRKTGDCAILQVT